MREENKRIEVLLKEYFQTKYSIERMNAEILELEKKSLLSNAFLEAYKETISSYKEKFRRYFIIDSVFESCSNEEKKLLIERYQKNKPWYEVSIACNWTRRGCFCVKDRIFKKISNEFKGGKAMGVVKDILDERENIYVFQTQTGVVHYLKAMHNREAMKLAGGLVNEYEDIVWLKDIQGNTIVHN